MKPSTILKKARKLVERGWTKGGFAARADGEATWSEDPEAVSWCMVGACERAASVSMWTNPAMDFLERVVPNGTVGVYNDSPRRTKQQVLRAFDRAIKLAISEGQ